MAKKSRKADAQTGQTMATADGVAPVREPAGGDPVEEACRDYGIPMGALLSASVDNETGIATLVTTGGIKLRWRHGEKLDTQPDLQRITGVQA